MLQGDYRRFYRYLQTFHSSSSLGHYRRWLTRWAYYLSTKEISPWNAKADDVVEFINQIRRDYHPQTVAHAISYLRAFYQWAIDREICERNPWLSARRPKEGRKLPNVISQEEMGHLLGTVKPRTTRDARDRAILYFLYSTGCRVSEVCTARMESLNLDTGSCIVRGKGNKDRLVPLAKEAVERIKYYIDFARPFYIVDGDDPGFIFLSHHGELLSRDRVNEAIERAKERAGITARVTPHTFRHAFATHLLENGADLMHVKELLGHATIATTQIYIHLAQPQLTKAYQMAHPLARKELNAHHSH